MIKIKRINIKTKEVINEYKVRKDEKILQLDNSLYIVSQEEYDNYINGKIETYEFNEPPIATGEYLSASEECLIIELY